MQSNIKTIQIQKPFSTGFPREESRSKVVILMCGVKKTFPHYTLELFISPLHFLDFWHCTSLSNVALLSNYAQWVGFREWRLLANFGQSCKLEEVPIPAINPRLDYATYDELNTEIIHSSCCEPNAGHFLRSHQPQYPLRIPPSSLRGHPRDRQTRRSGAFKTQFTHRRPPYQGMRDAA
jgi:hypothetical protein